MGDPTVKLKQGELKGKVVNNVRGGEYYSFQGIPYAKPPLGELRFKAPQPPHPWEGIRDATEHKDVSFQMDLLPPQPTVIGSEDCLYLNVYTPQRPSATNKELKPIMVWIHGGAFVLGSGNESHYGPEYLVKEDIILVTFNYRLGILGFLRINDPTLDVPGNAALKDMVMALKWVQENITHFGGDPHNVTVFGESAGGMCVHLLVLSPMAKGLFYRAIIQSGTVFSTWDKLLEADYTSELSEILNINETDNAKILQRLRELPVEELLQAQIKIGGTVIREKHFQPVVEKTSNEPAFLPDYPLNIIRSGKYNKVPLIFGYTSREGMLMASEKETLFPKTIEDLVPLNMRESNQTKKIAEEIQRFYFGGKEVSQENVGDLFLFFSDTVFIYPTYISLREHVKNLSHDLYFYRFSVDGKRNVLKKYLDIKEPVLATAWETANTLTVVLGVCHADELPYLFTNQQTPSEVNANSLEDLTIKRLTNLWVNFAKSGNPNPKETSDVISVKWQPIKENEFCYLEIGDNLAVGVNPDITRMKFWDDLYHL